VYRVITCLCLVSCRRLMLKHVFSEMALYMSQTHTHLSAAASY
jgi:hypothetical protein